MASPVQWPEWISVCLLAPKKTPFIEDFMAIRKLFNQQSRDPFDAETPVDSQGNHSNSRGTTEQQWELNHPHPIGFPPGSLPGPIDIGNVDDVTDQPIFSVSYVDHIVTNDLFQTFDHEIEFGGD